MDKFLDRFRCGWDSVTQGQWLPGDQWDLLSGLQSRCGVTRAEPSCVIDDMQVGKHAAAPGPLHPTLPRIAEQSDRTYATAEATSSPSPPSAQHPPQACSARSDGSDMPAGDREREKARLQRLLKDFAKECVAGIPVSVVNARTGRTPPYLFQMDRRLEMFSLRPSDGSSVENLQLDFSLQEVVAIFKGPEVANRAPCLGMDAAGCVGIDMRSQEQNLVLHFDDAYERDRFYTSLQVLKMSADIQQAG